MKVSWVTIDRICSEEARSSPEIRRMLERSDRPLRFRAEHLSDEELLEKLRGLGMDLDRRGLEKLCDGALSAEEVVGPLIAECKAGVDFEADWIWICLVTLWQRWWPDKPCLELLDDMVQAGYREQEQGDEAGCATIWLDAWADVLRLCDATGIRSIEEFDDRFPMTQSLYNWSQDVELALWNAGLADRGLLTARIEFCAEALRRFPREDQLMTENLRVSLARSYFATGMTARADELFQSWLAADPGWSWGWIGWADCYSGSGEAGDYSRAEELLRRGYDVADGRDRGYIAERLRDLCQETGRPQEARKFGQQARQLLRRDPTMSVSRSLDLAAADGPVVARETTTLNFGPDGVPLDQFADALRSMREQSPGPSALPGKVGRNAPCPCRSGLKFKKCCGSPPSRV